MTQDIYKGDADLVTILLTAKIAKLLEYISNTQVSNLDRQRVRRRITWFHQLENIIQQNRLDLRFSFALNEKSKRDFFLLLLEIAMILEYNGEVSSVDLRGLVDNFDYMNLYVNEDIILIGGILKAEINRYSKSTGEGKELELLTKYKRHFILYRRSCESLRINRKRYQKYMKRYNDLVKNIEDDYTELCISSI